MEPVLYRCQQKPGDLAKENVSGHLVNHQLPSIFSKRRTRRRLLLRVENQEIRSNSNRRPFFREHYFFGTKIKKSCPSAPRILNKVPKYAAGGKRLRTTELKKGY